MTDDDMNAWRTEVREMFARAREVPRDVVPGPGPTRDDLVRWNATVGQVVTGTIPGRLIEDVDGMPLGVEPSREITSIFGGASVTTAQLDAAGLTPDDVPNLDVIDPPNLKEAR